MQESIFGRRSRPEGVKVQEVPESIPLSPPTLNPMNIYSLKQIETPRLIIRPVQMGDEVELNQAINRSLKSLQRWMPWAKNPSLDATREFIQYGIWCWEAQQANDFPMVVIHKVDQRIIAASGFNEHSVPVKPLYELGYWIDLHYQGHGFITELVNALTRYALDALHAHRVQICTQVDNEKSIAVAKRCGFECEAIRSNDRIDCESGQLADGYIFSCCQTNLLAPLHVSWQHGEHKDECTIKPPKQLSLKPKIALPRLETTRLKLIPPREGDTRPSYEALMASLGEVSPWFSWAHKNLTVDQHHVHIKKAIDADRDIYLHDQFSFFIWDHAQKQFLGEIWYKIRDWSIPYITIAYWFDSRSSGHGYATEAIAEAVRYAFNKLRAKRVELDIPEQNVRSLRLAERLGFAFEGWMKNYSRNFVSNNVQASALYAMTDISQC